MEVTIESMVERWNSLDKPLIRGSLIDDDGRKCAQGDVLSCAGWSDDALRRMDQYTADAEVARILGISRTHAVLLRMVGDYGEGEADDVLRAPEKIGNYIFNSL